MLPETGLAESLRGGVQVRRAEHQEDAEPGEEGGRQGRSDDDRGRLHAEHDHEVVTVVEPLQESFHRRSSSYRGQYEPDQRPQRQADARGVRDFVASS